MMVTWFTYVTAFVFAVLFARKILDIEKRVKATKNQIGRLSLTFLKIENDINTLQDSLVVLAEGDQEKQERVIKLGRRRKMQFQRIVERGTNVSEMMRGLEEPDIDDDPNYWSLNRKELFEFREEESKK